MAQLKIVLKSGNNFDIKNTTDPKELADTYLEMVNRLSGNSPERFLSIQNNNKIYLIQINEIEIIEMDLD